MNIEDTTWVAGLLEGEGSFSLRKGGSPKVSCAMTDLDILERLQSLYKGRIYRTKKSKPHHKDAWVWVLHGMAAISLMHEVRPYMGIRRSSRIDEVFEDYEVHKVAVTGKRKLVSDRGRQAGQAYLNGDGTLRQLAARFHVSQVTVLNHYRKLK